MPYYADTDREDMRQRVERARRNTRIVWWTVAILFGIGVAYHSTR